MAAVLAGLDRLPAETGVLLVENVLAARSVDPDGEVVRTLAARRPRLADIPCHPTYGAEVALLCPRMIPVGPVGSWSSRFAHETYESVLDIRSGMSNEGAEVQPANDAAGGRKEE